MLYSKKRVLKKAIPDNDPNGLIDRIQVPRNLTIKGVDVHVNLAHPYNGDISIELSSPDGKKKTIQAPTRVPGKNLNKHYNGDMMAGFLGSKSKGEWTIKVVDSGVKDSGSLIGWTLQLELANSKKTEVFVDDKEVLSSAHICHQGGKISSMTAFVNIEHSHIGDLICKLISPSGNAVTLHNKTGGSQHNLGKNFSADELKAFKGETAQGKWVLEIADKLKGDSGRLLGWGLKIQTSSTSKISGKASKEDLTKIEGIGPKIKEILWKGGILSYRDLAKSDSSEIKKLLVAAGPRFKMHDPGSWPRQAQLASDGKWKELEKLQDELQGGK